ncbi:hypothetical protein SUGI_0121340, partial [Cryptomeria japonica]
MQKEVLNSYTLYQVYGGFLLFKEEMACHENESEGVSPRISFSFNLSVTDRTWSEKPKRENGISTKYAKEFEFCTVNNCIKTLSYADELFVDGKIRPPGRGLESQRKNVTRHLSLEKSRPSSPVRFASFPPSKSESAARKRRQKPAGRCINYYLCIFPFSRRKSKTKEFKPNSTVTKPPEFGKAITGAYSSPSYARNGKLMESYSPKALQNNSLPNISG